MDETSVGRVTGIYIHIPFCRSRCRYCDFYSTTLLSRRREYVDAVVEEAKQRIHALPRTIYFGGGTPSMLDVSDIERILRTITPHPENVEEITLEANPGDLSGAYLTALRRMGVNRLSIGIQTLDDTLLRTIGRRHTAAEAIRAVEMAHEAGFDNISVDLIYGLPSQTMAQVEADVEAILRLGATHISTYCLSYEDGTPLTAMRDRGDIEEQDDEVLNTMYDTICSRLCEAGYEHYEVSNFALPGCRSRHNSSYWNNTPYIGLGAGAHSYDGCRREWNPSDLDAYIEGIRTNDLVREGETLGEVERHEEVIMLGLRTSEGIDISLLEGDALTKADDYVRQGLLAYSEDHTHLRATQSGIHILNTIITELL